MRTKYSLTLLLLGGGCHAARTVPSVPSDAEAYFADMPASADPGGVAKRLVDNWLARPFMYEGTTSPGRYDSFVHYSEVATWVGALEVARVTGDADAERRLERKFDVFRTAAGAEHVSNERHVDFSVFGAVPLELFRVTRDSGYRVMGLGFVDHQWEGVAPDAISSEARYWADDMYMLPLLQLSAYRATGDRRYLDRTARMMVSYLDSLQKPNGLFQHGKDSPFYWGRGNGWAAAGLTELLVSLPEKHPLRPAVLAGYRRMMASLLRYQAPDGMWRQLIDHEEAWEESSGSAMFAFAMITGVRRGWLDASSYGPAARRAWIGLVGDLDDRANLREICVGTGKGSDAVGPSLEAQREYYLTRPRTTGDLHGQAPMLWAAAALM